MHYPNKLYTGYACIQRVFMLYSNNTRDIFTGISVRSDFTILNKYCFCDACLCDTYSQSESVCREHKDHGFFSRRLSEFSSLQPPNLWVLHIANSLQHCSYVE